MRSTEHFLLKALPIEEKSLINIITLVHKVLSCVF